MLGKTDLKEWEPVYYGCEGVSNPAKFIVVDDTQATKEGTATFTTYDQMGYKDTMQSVNGAGNKKSATAAMTWIPNIRVDGNYRVFAHIPKKNNTAKVVYSIAHNGKLEIRGLNQDSVDNRWILISPEEGFYFKAFTDSYVRLDNSNIPEDKKVGFDAIMFTAVEYGPAGGGEESPNPEICDNIDNDCNGEIDEGFDVGSSCAVGTGACERIGNKVCSRDGTTTVCNIATGDPSEEICDNIDNDCNGEIDEGFDVGALCAVGTGVCERIGHKVCSDDGLSAKCNVAAGMPNTEICGDGLDNDCDGQVDEVEAKKTPAITCPESITVEAEWLGRVSVNNPVIQAFLKGAAATDPEDGQLKVTNNAPKAFFSFGKTEVTFKAKDKDKNTCSCTAVVNVVDTTPPVITCPEDATIEATGPNGVPVSHPAIRAFLRKALSRDLITPGRLAVTNDAPSKFFGFGKTLVTFRAIDKAGNTNSCTANVTVKDTVAPRVRCKNITVWLNSEGKAVITVASVNNNSFDACGIATMNVSPDTFTSVGPYKVVLTATDMSGNKNTCTATVTVKAYKK